jgi:hypothetical protein
MVLDVQGSATARRAVVRRHVEQRALFELARFGDHIDVVRVRVTDRPPTAGARYHCGMAVTVVHEDGSRAPVLARAEGDEVFRLIDAVLARASTLVGGEIERARAALEARAEWAALAAAGSRRGS